MAKNLVIVESPTKVKTIQKFLGSHYDVEASNGHVRDLPKSQMGVDIDNDFEPKYITIRGKGELLASLRKKAKKADKIYLATDPDREGEAISWFLADSLNTDEGTPVYRVSFNEITKNAVKTALKNPRDINMNLVDAQQTRRILDRIVGYSISPILWAKVKRGLSAGRVQSSTLNMICRREAEIDAFNPREYWTIDALLIPPGKGKSLTAAFAGKGKDRMELPDEAACDAMLAEMNGKPFVVDEIKLTTRTQRAPLPFTTSTLQQEAARRLNFSTQKTMRIAQQLYEGAGKNASGLITYLRTDSVRISDEAAAAAKSFISGTYGEEYLGSSAGKTAQNSGRIQDAHEAIRPTDIENTPVKVKDSLSRDQYRLYQLIWKRFTASQMSDAVHETQTVTIGCGKYALTINDTRTVFDGFLSVYSDQDANEAHEKGSRKLKEGDVLTLEYWDKKQHFTQPPAHYTEASLVKAMEDKGIGRPSTYAPTISTLLARHYITKENRNIYVTELGDVVNQMLSQSFPSIVDETFTAKMETQLDEVEEGKIEWKNILRDFYPPFEQSVKQAEKELTKVKIEDEVTDVICENCGRNMVLKFGPHGKFLACPGFPECRNTKPYLEKIGVKCPKCGADIVIRKTRKGRRYYSCENSPNCDYMSWKKPSAETSESFS